MTMTLGHNTGSAEELMAFIERRERLEAERRDLGAAWINTLLQRLERHKGFVVAATNFGQSIDPAIWRRFDMHLSLELPGPFEREQILKRYLSPFGLPAASLAALAEAFSTASPALIRQFCEHLKRALVIGPRLGHDMRKTAVIGRITASVQPHPELGKPPMWATAAADRARDRAIAALPWPLPQASELAAEPAPPEPAAPNVVAGGGRRG
jgi:MoxR-like ATPase